MNDAMRGLMQKDAETILTYAECNMRLCTAANELGIGYKALIGRLNSIHKRSKLNPHKFRDLVRLVQIVEEYLDDDGYS